VAECPSCGRESADDARFCSGCGSELPLPGTEELRKTVTVVFCDLVGSTSLGERVDPESVRRAVGRYFDEARVAIERHGGTVEKFIGDAVMSVFGIPRLHEDDALRAVRAAAELRDAVIALGDELEAELGARIEARIGVATGEVVAGDPSSGQAFVTGDVVNVAARLEQAADPGEVLLGGRTLELGSGTGLNLPHYADTVTDLVLTEPFAPMAARLRAKLSQGVGREDRGAQVVETPAESLPFEDESFDSVVATLVLCTVDDPAAVVSEVGRVLRPGGSLILLEHVRAETPGLARAQDLLHGPWFLLGHGCHCNRDTVAVIRGSQLEFESLERGEMSGVAPLVKPIVAGVARLP